MFLGAAGGIALPHLPGLPFVDGVAMESAPDPHVVLWWILIASIWIAIAFWPARITRRKGHSQPL